MKLTMRPSPAASSVLRRALSTKADEPVKHPSWFLKLVNNNDYNVPRLPVPQLNDTLEKYLRSVQPLITPDEYKEHKKLVEDFGLGQNRSVGRSLQDELIKQEFMNAMGRAYPYSYIEAWWDAMYLGGRYPNPINVNPGYGLVNEPAGTTLADPLTRASSIVVSLLKWFGKVKSGTLEQDPKQCMAAYAKQLGTAKIPANSMDVLQFHPRSEHIVVLHRNAFYKVQVLDGKKVVSQASLQASLGHISTHGASSTAPNIAVLTSEDRDVWANVRTNLRQEPVNKASLDAIDSALFVLVLDDSTYTDDSALSAATLHGKNGANRWFDKLQLIAYPDGHIAVNFEHTFSDGTNWNRWLHEVWHDIHKTDSGFAPLTAPDGTFDTPSSAPSPLVFSLNSAAHAAIDAATARATADTANNETHLLRYNKFGKNTIKTWGLSPDGIVQMALQLAFFKQNNRLPPTYESCSTRGFFHGRTETIRSATSEALRFVSSVTTGAPLSSQREFLVKAVDRHVANAKEAQKGLGVDRHLTMLNHVATTSGISHDFLKSTIRRNATNFQLSTSNVTMPFLDYFCFGAVVPTGYGVGYLIQNDHLPINITSFVDCPTTSSPKFAEAVKDALDTVHAIGQSPK
ncbi:hypothetical protein DYB32_002017 [Aphanomyces invadans]|uniref:Choline/carnitine acyltransferase domain-containing protein n=1 Tax=Aphanomyces invadans TaxID=157072 RepID=A0A3R6ZVF4_9STRA|nr:hypothetical protein DYB32_002017 [Aphanomyces invadans]